jgi:hypothetical protein
MPPVVVAKAEVQRQIVGDAPPVLEKEVVASIPRVHVESADTRRSQRDVELIRIRQRIAPGKSDEIDVLVEVVIEYAPVSALTIVRVKPCSVR